MPGYPLDDLAGAEGALAEALAAPDVAAAVDETVVYLESDDARAALLRDPYWPKWESPWWRMTLLWELGLARRIPRPIADAMVEALNAHYLHTFPIRPGDAPATVAIRGREEPFDGWRHSACHCALGTMAQVLLACGIDVDAAVPWIRPWALRYQLPDGGLNCDETAYVKSPPRSSMLSTLPVAEAMLALFPDRSTRTEAVSRFLGGAARYLEQRRLVRSISKGMALIDPAWLVPCFPRFYDYDVLRGLRFLARWKASRPDAGPTAEVVAEAREACARWFAAGLDPAGPAPRAWWKGVGTVRLATAGPTTGRWEPKQPHGTFSLLEIAAKRRLAAPALAVEWAAVSVV